MGFCLAPSGGFARHAIREPLMPPIQSSSRTATGGRQRRGWKLVVVGLIGGIIAMPGGTIVSWAQSPVAKVPPPDQIDRWIEQLGADRFTTRRRARRALARVGLPAFEQLILAGGHPDAEIAAAARSLTIDPDIEWFTPTDSTDVIDLLGDYREQQNAERRETIDGLGQLPVQQSAAPLLRLARYESNESLARAASVALLSVSNPSDERSRQATLAVFDAGMPTDLSTSSPPHWQWLAARGEDLRAGSVQPHRWSAIIDAAARRADHSDAPATGDSLRVAQIIATQWPDDADHSAVDFVLDHLSLLPPQTDPIAELAGWAIDHGLASIVAPLRQRYPAFFDASSRLQYLVAEAAVDLQQQTKANEVLSRIESDHPLIAARRAGEVMDRATADRRVRHRLGVAFDLQLRGQFAWAIREYRWIAEGLPIESGTRATADYRLASLYIELERFGDVVEQLQPVVERLDADDELSEELRRFTISTSKLRSLLEFSRGQVAAAEDRNDAAAAAYSEALAADPENIDILIAMYHLPGDAAWRQRVDAMLDQKNRPRRAATTKRSDR